MQKNNSQKLDEALAALRHARVPSNPPAETVERTMEAMRENGWQADQAENEPPINLTERLGVMRPLTKIAAAAVIILAVSLGVWFFAIRPERTTPDSESIAAAPQTPPQQTPPPATDQSVQTKDRSSETDQLERQLLVLIAAAAQDDTNKLIEILYKADYPIKVLAAKYLGDVGDQRAIAALEQISDQWNGPAEENPFILAIRQIRSRQQQNKSHEGAKSGLEPQGPLSGTVTDAATGQPIDNALINISAQSSYQIHTDSNGFYCFEDVAEPGSYAVTIRSDQYVDIDYGQIPRIALNPETKTVKHFVLQPACMINIEVVDPEGNPVQGARVSGSSLTDTFNSSVDYDLTDANGTVTLGGFEQSDIPYLFAATAGQDANSTSFPYAPARTTVALTDTSLIEHARIQLAEGTEVHGYIEYADGVPAGDVEVLAAPQWLNNSWFADFHQVDTNGYFTLKNITQGRYKVHYAIRDSEDHVKTSKLTTTPLPPSDGLLRLEIPQKSPGSRG